MAVYSNDPGDRYDSIKWDFREDTMPIFIIGKYPYKAKNIKNAQKLAYLRQLIDSLCDNLIENRDNWENSTDKEEYIEGIYVFLKIHCEQYYDTDSLPEPFYTISLRGLTTSRYLLSEMPKGTIYDGLSKPKMRYNDPNEPSVGKDGSSRALYRDIFLNLNLNDKALKKLIIHELAHTAANHVYYRPDDHHADFKWAENLIKNHWPENV